MADDPKKPLNKLTKEEIDKLTDSEVMERLQDANPQAVIISIHLANVLYTCFMSGVPKEAIYECVDQMYDAVSEDIKKVAH